MDDLLERLEEVASDWEQGAGTPGLDSETSFALTDCAQRLRHEVARLRQRPEASEPDGWITDGPDVNDEVVVHDPGVVAAIKRRGGLARPFRYIGRRAPSGSKRDETGVTMDDYTVKGVRDIMDRAAAPEHGEEGDDG